jgi:acyl carrier protein
MNPIVWPRLQVILASILGASAAQITPESSPATIESWDSLNHLNLALALEQEFKINFTPEEIERLTSAANIGVLVERKLNGHGAA